jgi:3-hydroxyisobutyrate dehydrogenase-like beta-hydroxyacid dehydrogenase
MLRIGFIGLGNMGQSMAKNIQKAGYPMVVCDVREEAKKDLISKGAQSAGTPSEVATLCDIVFTSLPGPVEVEEVALGKNGLMEGIHNGSVYVDLSTNRPALVRKIAAIFKEKGADVLDAPVSGGVPGAASGNLAIMVGGDKVVFDKIKPVFDSFVIRLSTAGKSVPEVSAKLLITAHRSPSPRYWLKF